MSASVIQRKAAFAVNIGSGSVAVTLDNPISAGSTVVIAAAVVQTDGSGISAISCIVRDDHSNFYTPTSEQSSGNGFFANTYQTSINPATGAQTYTLTYTAQAGQSAYDFLAGLCIYELSGVTLSSGGSNSTGTSGVHAPSSLSTTISGLSGGSFGNLLVSIYAGIFTSTLSDAQAVAAGSGWVLDGRVASDGTNSPMAIVFQSQFVGVSSNPAATVTSTSNSTAIDDTLLVAAYALTSAIPGGGGSGGSGGSGGGGTSTTFLGSVMTEVGSPSLELESGDCYLGNLTIIDSAPSGVPCPFLGTVKIVASANGRPSPALGHVVVLTSPPSNNSNPTLGAVTTD
jgi:hypothetical protein